MHRHGVRLLAAASQRAPRESPTALLFLSGPLQAPAAFAGAAAALAELGFASYSADLLRPQFALCTCTPDALVDRLHAALHEARVFSPPVAIAGFAEAVVLQKYLESFPLAGAALISPLPPAPAPGLHAILRSSGAPDAALPKSAACSTAGAASAALAAALAPRARSADAARMAAAFLLRLAQEPVNLEPQPVPMLLLQDGSADGGGVAATAALHGLAPQQHDAQATALRQWVAARF